MEKLVFRLEEIPPDGLEFDLAPDPRLYGIEEVSVARPPGISGWVRIVKDKREVEVTGEVRAELELPCDRCLAQARAPVSGEFSYRLVPRYKAPRDEDVELEEGDMEVEFYDGDEVDVRRIIAEQVYLLVPVRVLCRPDCRGLCPTCGQDLNLKDCGHPRDAGDGRWEALKGLKGENGT